MVTTAATIDKDIVLPHLQTLIEVVELVQLALLCQDIRCELFRSFL